MAISGTHDHIAHVAAESGRPHEVLGAGALGAGVVWLWMLVSGALTDAPLHLANLVGSGFTQLAGAPLTPEWVAVLVFTAFHFAVWIGIAGLVGVVLRVAVETPAILMLAVVVAILLLLALVGATMIFASNLIGDMAAWSTIFAGTIFGVTATTWYLLRGHPEVRSELARIDDDD